MTDKKDYLSQSFRQCLFKKVLDNELMLPWYMGLKTFHYVSLLCLWHMKCQKCNHILD